MNEEIVLGETYRDKASGFVGMATGKAEYLGDTPSVRLTANTGPNVAVVHEWFPPDRLVIQSDKPTGFNK